MLPELYSALYKGIIGTATALQLVNYSSQPESTLDRIIQDPQRVIEKQIREEQKQINLLDLTKFLSAEYELGEFKKDLSIGNAEIELNANHDCNEDRSNVLNPQLIYRVAIDSDGKLVHMVLALEPSNGNTLYTAFLPQGGDIATVTEEEKRTFNNKCFRDNIYQFIMNKFYITD